MLDDMDVSPDFFAYFAAMRVLLKSDPTLFCISSWNDNGKKDHVHDARKSTRLQTDGGGTTTVSACDVTLVYR